MAVSIRNYKGQAELHVRGLPSLNVMTTNSFYDGYIAYIHSWNELSITRDPSALLAMSAGLSLCNANSLLNADKGILVMFSLAERTGRPTLMRGIIEKRESATIALVYLIDYGFSQRVQVRQLSELPDEFKKQPPLSFPVKFTDADRLPSVYPSAFDELRFTRVTAEIDSITNTTIFIKSLTAFTATSHYGIAIQEAVSSGTKLERLVPSIGNSTSINANSADIMRLSSEKEAHRRDALGLTIGWVLVLTLMILAILACFLFWLCIETLTHRVQQGEQLAGDGGEAQRGRQQRQGNNIYVQRMGESARIDGNLNPPLPPPMTAATGYNGSNKTYPSLRNLAGVETHVSPAQQSQQDDSQQLSRMQLLKSSSPIAAIATAAGDKLKAVIGSLRATSTTQGEHNMGYLSIDERKSREYADAVAAVTSHLATYRCRKLDKEKRLHHVDRDEDAQTKGENMMKEEGDGKEQKEHEKKAEVEVKREKRKFPIIPLPAVSSSSTTTSTCNSGSSTSSADEYEPHGHTRKDAHAQEYAHQKTSHSHHTPKVQKKHAQRRTPMPVCCNDSSSVTPSIQDGGHSMEKLTAGRRKLKTKEKDQKIRSSGMNSAKTPDLASRLHLVSVTNSSRDSPLKGLGNTNGGSNEHDDHSNSAAFKTGNSHTNTVLDEEVEAIRHFLHADPLEFPPSETRRVQELLARRRTADTQHISDNKSDGSNEGLAETQNSTATSTGGTFHTAMSNITSTHTVRGTLSSRHYNESILTEAPTQVVSEEEEGVENTGNGDKTAEKQEHVHRRKYFRKRHYTQPLPLICFLPSIRLSLSPSHLPPTYYPYTSTLFSQTKSMFNCMGSGESKQPVSVTSSVHQQVGHNGSRPLPFPPRRGSADDGQPKREKISMRDRARTPPPQSTFQKAKGMKRLDRWIQHLLNEGSTRPVMSKAREWQYADDVRVSVTPVVATPPPHPYGTPSLPPQRSSRGQAALAALREREEERRLATAAAAAYAQRQADVYAEPAYARHLDGMNVVFLQANDEVKRAILPRDLHSLDQVKMAFVRAFPNITRHYIDNPRVRIYIQEQSKGSLFYELDDPMDIKDKTILKLKEKHPEGVGGASSPVMFDVPDYQSETEMERPNTFYSLARPASAMARTEFATVPAPTAKAYQRQQSRTPQLYEDSYASDTNSHDGRGSSSTRSGSITPSLDKESRVRMDTMERQLAGLSSLVHSALVSKGMSESTQRDMAALRREILALHGSDAGRETSEEPLSIPESLSSHTQHQLGTLRYKVQQANTEIRQLRRIAQVNAHTARNLIREAADEINRILAQKLPQSSRVSVERSSTGEQRSREMEKEKSLHADQVAGLLEELTRFEQNVEDVRSSVLANKKKLRMTEVEALTEKLSDIGRNAARLKTEFPSIQTAVEKQLKEDMERIVREEKYIRDQLMAVDQSLRRCKALAAIMVTMKKLAMVQDPTLQRKNKENGLPPHPPAHSHAPSAPPSSLPSTPAAFPIAVSSGSVPPTPTSAPPTISYQPQHASASATFSTSSSSIIVPSASPTPTSTYQPQSSQFSNQSQSSITQPSMVVVAPSMGQNMGNLNGPNGQASGQSVGQILGQAMGQQNGTETNNSSEPVDPQKEVPAPYVPNVARNEPPLLPPLPSASPAPNTDNLDGILDELIRINYAIKLKFWVGRPGIPPRPPSRFSVLDVRQKFTKPPELPEQLKNIIDDVARRASPAPVEKKQEIEERQQRLDEKQRHLQSQFQQLQQLTTK